MTLGPITKVADRGQRNSSATGNAVVTLTNPTLITRGNYLVFRVAVDNTGASGAAPGLTVSDSRTHTWTVGSGWLNDPGAASAGITCYVGYVKVATAFLAGDTVTFTWTTGSPVSAIVIEEWSGIHSSTPLATAQNGDAGSTATPSTVTTIAANTVGVCCYAVGAIEGQSADWGAQDSDTLNGSWSDLTKDQGNTGTNLTSVSVYGGYKVVTGTGAQTWNNTLVGARDWVVVGLAFAPGQTQAVSGGITPSGALPRQTNKALTAGITPAGALTYVVNKVPGGSITSGGALTKRDVKTPFTAGITPAGALARASMYGRAVSGTVATAGSVTKQDAKRLVSTVTSSGAPVKQTAHVFAGTLTPTGDPDARVAYPLTGSTFPTGTLAKTVLVAVAGSVNPSGEAGGPRHFSQDMGGSVLLVGAITATRIGSAIITVGLKTTIGSERAGITESGLRSRSHSSDGASVRTRTRG